jgi:hypothetical protein
MMAQTKKASPPAFLKAFGSAALKRVIILCTLSSGAKYDGALEFSRSLVCHQAETAEQ